MPIVRTASSPIPRNPRIYHITDVNNLLSIARNDLLCANAVHNTGTRYTNIAHGDIQRKRATTSIPCGPRGYLHDYVPLHFAPRSPMMYAIHMGNVEGHKRGQRAIVYLVSSVTAVVDAGLPFVFSDGHAITKITNFYTSLADINRIDWEIMEAHYWRNDDEDGDRVRRRNAEFLVQSSFPWTLVEEIGVIDATMAAMVRGILEGSPHQPEVNVRRGWYY